MNGINIKKVTAVAAAAAVMSTLTGCGEKTTWGADIDQERIPAGIFIYYLYNSYYTAQGRVTQEANEAIPEGADTADIPEPDLFSSQIDGKDSKQWIYDEATKSMQEYAAVEAKFDELGLTLTDEEKEAAKIYCDQLWEYAGEYYVGMGISQNSYNKIYLNSEKRNKLFTGIYSEGGQQAVSDDELRNYLDENYAMINFIKMELRDGEGNLLKSDGKAERMVMAEEYILRYKNGEDFDALGAEYEAFYQELQAEAAANAEDSADMSEDTGDIIDMSDLFAEVEGIDAEADESSDEDGVTEEAGTDETEAATAEDDSAAEESVTDTAEDGSAAEEPETDTAEDSGDPIDIDFAGIDPDMSFDDGYTYNAPSSNLQVIEKIGTNPDSAVVTAVFEEMEKGDIKVVESTDGEYYYIVLKLDVIENDDYLDTAKDSLLYEMKSDEFDSLITSWTELQTVNRNEDAYKRYDPEKMFGE